jgi:penicillin-binding protein 1C
MHNRVFIYNVIMHKFTSVRPAKGISHHRIIKSDRGTAAKRPISGCFSHFPLIHSEYSFLLSTPINREKLSGIQMKFASMWRRHRKIYFYFCAAFLVSAVCFSLLSLLFPLPQPKPYSVVIYDQHGDFLQAFLSQDGMWRLKTPPSEIPARFKKLLLYKEDKYFYYHPGINPLAVIRASIQNLVSGRRISGASTITMQVARMLEPKERTFGSKIVEMFRALQLELKYSKEEILQMYLSMIPLGGNVEGLKSAALLYYRTPLERLNTAQLFDLMLVPNNPNGLRPDRFPERLHAERAVRSVPFFRSGILNGTDSTVFAQTPTAVERRLPALKAPHFCLHVKEMIKEGGDFRTSLDLKVQAVTERLLKNHLRTWKVLGVQNGAVMVIENKTMRVAAYAGSDDFEDSLARGQVDAVQALRSPGSTLKPFLYALQMDKGILTPKTRLLDVPYDAEGYTAENYDGTYSGYVFADDALRKSLNVPMVRLLKNAGLTSFASLLYSLGFKSIEAQRERLGLSMILGGCGVTLEELTSAYAAFPNEGMYAPARYFIDTSAVLRTPVFSEAAAFMITDILSGVDRPDLPHNFESAVNLPLIAFKTGTSYGRRDAWTVGYSAEYTVGVWVGNVTNRGNPDLVGSKSAAPLLVDILNSISRTHRKFIMKMPADVNTRDVCAESGKLPTPRCKHLIEEYYSMSNTLSAFCDIDNEYMVSADRKVQYCVNCVGSRGYRIVTYKDYPKELLNYWKRIGKSYKLAPPHNPLCDRVFSGEGPKIISPTNGMVYLLTANDQKVAFQASSGVDVHEQCWYLNNRYLGRIRTGDKLFLPLETGEYTASCLDDKGRLSSVKISVKHL